ncbi:hypothetical protein GALL_397670 [mine drainage metagenome]|uniref:DUF2946 domain-containing protein n=1 Tax=mine drainage metagenome TaxID=410659 RepID=A0A1J5Q5L9_9ZZZZ
MLGVLAARQVERYLPRMNRRNHANVALLSTLRVLLVVCLAWLAPMPAVAMTNSAPHDTHMTTMQAHCVTQDASDGLNHDTGKSHHMSCCLVCAGTTVVGDFVMSPSLGAALQANWQIGGASWLAPVEPDPSLRPPNTSSIA